MAHKISAASALDLLAASSCDMLDVRSEGEFAVAAIPGALNAPILRNPERHEVGLCYRQRGQAAAIDLGYQLVGPVQETRVQEWLRHVRPDAPLVLCCWRGGLRSSIAAEWIEATGREVWVVEGGYKALRHELLEVLARPQEFRVISGLTGAGKTRLLDALPLHEKINIEECAAHRGSSFGRFMHRTQPTQTTFENRLALGLRFGQRPVLVEDESKVIGSLHLPEAIYAAMIKSPLIILEASLAERCENIYREYVAEVLASGVEPQSLEQSLMASTYKLQRRLGGLLTSKIIDQLQTAFASGDPEAHYRWIEMLLSEYYDGRYRHSQVHGSRPLLFRGTYEECREWILEQYV
ncbi:tRNA 2-selenouridine(34) synthase MnmH [Oligoflexus tunisiensis]|uniref:tRNA 2-selenouridine(34) synthase MnmH n=1 Tax=Oligoflexus tunisiensis TaxID=708132 RepID=UPI000ACD5882|nr:tRNA 2-selenouridine(34) synthase MnmH [Oligoflexus tunisiensis]